MRSLWLRHRVTIIASIAAACAAAGLVFAVTRPTSKHKRQAGRASQGLPAGRPNHRTAVIFSGNWETGTRSQWGAAQCANTGVAPGAFKRGTLNIVTDVVAQGKYAARIDLPPGEPASACEVFQGRTEALGTDDWYALEVRFPPDWREPASAPWGLAIAQFDYERVAGPPVGLFAHADHVNLNIAAGFCNNGACQYNTGNDDHGNQGTLGYTLRITPVGTQLAGTWQQFIVHVHHAADSSGVVQGWWRPRGGSWTKTIDWGGYPTVQWTSTQPVDTNYGTADKIGGYRGTSSFPISIWQDGFCRATSFSAAESCL